MKPGIVLFHGHGLISSLIRWQTRGKYSHAAILTHEGTIVESWQGAGVRERPYRPGLGIDIYDVPGMSEDQWHTAIGFARSQIGMGYDYWAVIRFVSRRSMPDNADWFCSELVYKALKKADVDLFARIEAWAVSPGLICISSRIEPRTQPQPINEVPAVA